MALKMEQNFDYKGDDWWEWWVWIEGPDSELDQVKRVVHTSLIRYQNFDYKGDDWWEWWVWIEGPDSELDQVKRVVYTLHPTFPNPVRTISDRSTKFRLKSAGWGTFRIFARVFYKSGEP